MVDELEMRLAQLWTLDGFDSHVADWLAQLPRSHERKQQQQQYEDAFLVFEKIDEPLEDRGQLKAKRKSESGLDREATNREISKLDEEVGALYLSIGLGPDGKTPALPVVAASAPGGEDTEQAGPVLKPTPNPAPEPQAAPVVAEGAPGGVEPDQAESQAAPVKAVAEEAPVSEPPKRRRTWWSVASAYMVDVMRAGQYATAKQLFNELDKTAGPNSPFEKGTGNQRGSLFVREIGKPLALKTVQTNWPKLKEAAQK